ncbi:DUF2069 domain-containing protein [Gammaproteobacteria bacterium]|nr:DUF2069 domain-containing protein [Gammaproteobacteria bacterium]
MFNLSNLKLVTNAFILLLILVKLLTVLDGRTYIITFVIWSLPFVIFYFFANNYSIKSYQSFCFILLIYFMPASVNVFGVMPRMPYFYDLIELILIVLFFIHCMYGPKTIRNNV